MCDKVTPIKSYRDKDPIKTGLSIDGGGGGNRTRVRKPSAPRSTCLFR